MGGQSPASTDAVDRHVAQTNNEPITTASALELLRDLPDVLPRTPQVELGSSSSFDFSKLGDIYGEQQFRAPLERAFDGPTKTGAEKFFGQPPSDQLLEKWARYGIPREQAEQVRSEIEQNGRDPLDVAAEAMKNNRVVAFGESHLPDNPQRVLGAEAMQRLRDSGATHLAIEAPMWVQPYLDEFMRTGNLDVSQLPPLLRDDEYIQMLQAARAAGLKIVAVDANQQYNEGDRNDGPRRGDDRPYQDRDRIMADNIDAILRENPNNKVVFWVGSLHLQNRENPPGQHRTAAEILKQKYSVATIVPITDWDRGIGLYPLGEITADIDRPAAVATRDTPNLAGLKQHDIPNSSYDYVFIYPGRRRR